MTRGPAGALLLLAAACAAGTPQPVVIDLAHDACASCRMVISSTATAAEVVAPGEEPRLFDDIGCLRKGLAESAPPADAVIYVADHVSGAWLRAEQAVFTHVPALQTPMGSGLVAHRDAAGRDGDAAARGGSAVTIADALGRNWP